MISYNPKIHFLVRVTIFWLLFFALFRVLFILYHHEQIPDGEHSETSLSFLYALRLDLATISVMILIPYLLWTFQQFYKSRLIHRINLTYTILLICIVSILSILNIKIYGEHKMLLTAEDLVYLSHSKKTITLFSIWSLLLLLSTSAFFAYIGIQLYRNNITNFSHPIENKNKKIALILLIPFLLFLEFRGGIQKIQISEKNVRYSNRPINNDIATNNIWFLGHTCVTKNDTLINETRE